MRKVAISAAVVAALAGVGLWVLSREETLIWSAERVAAKTGGRLQYADLRGSLLVPQLAHVDRAEE